MTRDKINLILIKLGAWLKLYRNLGEYKEASRKYLHKTDLDKTEVYLNNVVRICTENVCKFLTTGPFHK